MPLRKRLKGLLLPGQHELHFHKEKRPRRRILADQIAQLPINIIIYRTPTTARTEEQDRQRCLERAVTDLCNRCAHRLVIDSRSERDSHDRATIYRTVTAERQQDSFAYHHVPSEHEPPVWSADVSAWCFGAGGDWRRRIMPIVDKVIDL